LSQRLGNFAAPHNRSIGAYTDDRQSQVLMMPISVAYRALKCAGAAYRPFHDARYEIKLPGTPSVRTCSIALDLLSTLVMKSPWFVAATALN
jgi:hypothetical protein